MQEGTLRAAYFAEKRVVDLGHAMDLSELEEVVCDKCWVAGFHVPPVGEVRLAL